jgi:hypothetical protein
MEKMSCPIYRQFKRRTDPSVVQTRKGDKWNAELRVDPTAGHYAKKL